MTDCVLCGEREVEIDGKWCSLPCKLVSPEGIELVETKHVLKAAQKVARQAALVGNLGGGMNPNAILELQALAADDDGIDR